MKEEIVEAIKQQLISQRGKGVIVSFADAEFLKKENEHLEKILLILEAIKIRKAATRIFPSRMDFLHEDGSMNLHQRNLTQFS